MKPQTRIPTLNPQKAGSHPGRKRLLVSIVVVVLLLLCVGVFFTQKALAPDRTPGKAIRNNGSSPTPSAPAFDKDQYSLDDPASIWVIVNKDRELNPKNYAPKDLVFPNVPLRVPGNESMQLRKEPAAALEELVAGARTAGLDLMLASGYRSYGYQVGLYNGYVQKLGQAEADKTSARPGHSEHQTGLAADLESTTRECELETCFGDTAEGKWLAQNAFEYGFIIRYTKDKTAITGYSYEPWHLRYVGPELAAELKKQNIETLEEFFNTLSAQSY